MDPNIKYLIVDAVFGRAVSLFENVNHQIAPETAKLILTDEIHTNTVRGNASEIREFSEPHRMWFAR